MDTHWTPLVGIMYAIFGYVTQGYSTEMCMGLSSGSHCYTVHEESVTWSEAQLRCRRRRGSLAAITDSTTQRLAETLTTDIEGAVWLGAQKTDPRDTLGNRASLWRWVDRDCPGCSIPTACSGGKVDLAFLLDNSGSMTSESWDAILQYVGTLVDQLEIGPEAAMVSVAKFGNQAQGIMGLGDMDNKTALLAAISVIPHDAENTNTADGLRFLRTNVFTDDRPEVPNVAVIFTDGKSTMDADATLSEARLAKDAGIQLYVIGVTDHVDEAEVSGIASPPQQPEVTYWLVPDFESLATVDILPSICAWQKRQNIIHSTAVMAQGCFHDDVTSPDLPVSVSITSVLPDTCMDACADRGYPFSGVRVTKANISTLSALAVCHCGVQFCRYGIAGDCTVPCPDRPEVYCGGYGANAVYKAGGEYIQWSRGEPNNLFQYQFCGAMDSRWDNDMYKMADLNCDTKLRYTCQLPFEACSDPEPSDDGHYDITPTMNLCLYTSVHRDTWHRSRTACIDKQGDLVAVRNATLHADVRTVLKQYYTAETEYTWVGLESHAMFWDTVDPAELTWSNFAPDEPDFSSGDCVYLDRGSLNQWRLGNCTYDTAAAYICQRDYQPPTTTTTTTSTTSSSSVENAVVPGFEASTKEESFVNRYWWLILIIVVLILAVVFLIIIFCYHKKKQVRRPSLSPRVRLWDALSDQGSPISMDDDPLGFNSKIRKLYYSDLNAGYLIKSRGASGNFFTQTDRIYLP